MAFCPGCGHERCTYCPVESIKKKCYVLVDEIMPAAHTSRRITSSLAMETPKGSDAGLTKYFK